MVVDVDNDLRKCAEPLIEGAQSARQHHESIGTVHHYHLAVAQVVAFHHLIDHGIGALHKSLRHHAHNVCASIVSGLRHGVHQA